MLKALLLVQVLDVQAVRAEGDPRAWVHEVHVPESATEVSCDLLVAGQAWEVWRRRSRDRAGAICLPD